MAATKRSSAENALIAALPADEHEILSAKLERVDLTFKKSLQEFEKPVQFAYFPISGVCSAVSRMEDGATVELATIGREGMVGLPLLLEAEQIAHAVVVQVPGEGYRIAASAFVPLIDRLPALRRLLLRYILAFVTQVAQGSACNRLHPVEARCARWLLQTHDRVDGDIFSLTQEFLGQMLGVTRPSVSIAAGMLQKAGMIRYVRGEITIVDRDALERASCECYGIIRAEFERMIGRRG